MGAQQDSRRPNRRRGHGQGAGRGRGRGGSNRGARGGFSTTEPRQQQGEHSSNEDDTQTPPAAVVKPARTIDVPEETPTFEDVAKQGLIHPSIMQAVIEDMKFTHMMPVQASTLWELLPPGGHDCLVQAKTGTGKTVAFLLPALQKMLATRQQKSKEVSLLVLSPTRELAMQIAQEASSLLQRLPGYRVCIAIGGTNKDKEEARILQGCHVLVATPGRLIDHLSNEHIVSALSSLDTLVLDEADRLLDMGFLPAIKDIVRHLPDRNQVNRQCMLFSATVPTSVEKVSKFVLLPNHKFISTISEGDINTHERVPQLLIKVPTFAEVAAAMVGAIREDVKKQTTDYKAIVFAPTARLADLYGYILSHMPDMPPVSTLHSRLSQNKRTSVTNAYRDAPKAILVATDVIARGMDFAGVTTVLQVGIPSDKESYVHRLGRTARADAEGRGVFIVCEAEDFFPRWTLKGITFVPTAADTSSSPEIEKILDTMPEDDRGDIYKTWLGYYNNHMKGLRWDRAELVRQANIYARNGLEMPDTPTIQRSTVGKMGLRGTPGLNIIPDKPKARSNRGGQRGRG